MLFERIVCGGVFLWTKYYSNLSELAAASPILIIIRVPRDLSRPESDERNRTTILNAWACWALILGCRYIIRYVGVYGLHPACILQCHSLEL